MVVEMFSEIKKVSYHMMNISCHLMYSLKFSVSVYTAGKNDTTVNFMTTNFC